MHGEYWYLKTGENRPTYKLLNKRWNSLPHSLLLTDSYTPCHRSRVRGEGIDRRHVSCTAILANTRQENSVGLLLGERRRDHTPTPCPRSCPNEYQIRLFLTRRVGEGGGVGGVAQHMAFPSTHSAVPRVTSFPAQ